MRLIGVHTAIGDEAEQMELASAGARVLHRIEQDRLFEELAILDHELNPGGIHVHDASRSDIEVPDFAVSHLAVRETYERAAGMDQGVRIFAQQTVISWLAGQCDCIGFGFGSITPAVKNDKNERFRTRHSYVWLLAKNMIRKRVQMNLPDYLIGRPFNAACSTGSV